MATELAERLDLPQTLIEGRRVTDESTLRIAVMVYAGMISKSIVAGLQSKGVRALGLMGADLDLIRAKKRAPEPVDYGFVGDITHINAEALVGLVDSGAIPVIAPLTHDGEGQILNTNADSIAHHVARALAKTHSVTLVYSFEKEGVLLDVKDEKSVLRQITVSEFRTLKAEGRVFEGMIPKLDNAFQAIEAGVHQVIMGKAQSLPSLIEGTAGTRLVHGR